MPRRTLKDKNIRKLYKHPRGTTTVSIPKEIVDTLRWRDGQKVVVERKGKNVVIKDWVK